MIKKTITYEDYLGNVRTEDFYFNLSKNELRDMQSSVDGGLNVQFERMVNAKNTTEIYNTFVKIVHAAYGELSPDGRYLLKEDDEGHKLYKKFIQSPAYDVLMDEICKDETTIAAFYNGIVPKEIAEAAKEAEKNTNVVNIGVNNA